MANACRLRHDEAEGNVYFRGEWDFCTEYDTGDLVIYHGLMFMSLCHQAGHEPTQKGSHEYWIPFGMPHKHFDDDDIDGGYATTIALDIYEDEDLAHKVDGGSSIEDRHIPLV